MPRHPNCKPLSVTWADLPDTVFDPGVRYAVTTPSGIHLTLLKPAAAHGSSAFVDFVNRRYAGRESEYKTQ